MEKKKQIGRREFIKSAGAIGVGLGAVGLLGASIKVRKATALGLSNDVKVYAFKTGILKTQTQRILKDTRVGVPMDIPVPFFLIRHGASWVAFDTGNNAAVAKDDPVKYWGAAVVKAYTPVMKPHEAFKIQIRKLGLRPKDIKCLILSHGHLDHAGGIEDFRGTNVPIYVQKKELEVINKSVASGKITAYIPADFKYMNELNIKPIEGTFDIFGDQTVVAFPTPGHTPGHQSLLVNPGTGKPWIFCADASYTLENMTARIAIGLYSDIQQVFENLDIFQTMQFMGAEIIPQHDPNYWRNKTFAPGKLRL